MGIVRQAWIAMAQRLDATLSKGLLILETLARSTRPLGISELAVQLGLNKSNVHRLTSTLRAMEYVAQEPDRTYRCTMKVWRLGNAVMSHMNLPALAVPAMRQLANVSGETVHLSVLDGTTVLYIDKIDSEHPVRAYSERGGSAPLHCVATGKILLAFNYEFLRSRIATELVRHTARTITSLEQLDHELAQVRRTGIATNVGEYRDDVGGIGAPIYDPSGRVIAAIGISGPLSRLTRQVMRKQAPAVVEAGKRISEAIGSTTPVTAD